MIYVTLRFDDGTVSQYSEAFNYMRKYNIPGSIYVVGKHLLREKPDSRYVNWDQLVEMERGGWEVGYHSYSHDVSWIDDPSRYPKETDATKLVEKGLSISTFALPHSKYNYQVLCYLGNRFEGILGIPSKAGNPTTYKPFHDLYRSYTITQKTSLEELRERLETTINSGDEYLVFLFHKIERESDNIWSFPVKRFRNFIKMLTNYQEEGTVEVVTFRDAIKSLECWIN